MKRGFLKTFEIFFLEKTFKILVGVIHGRVQYTGGGNTRVNTVTYLLGLLL
jgi:hypothetical protein